MRAMFSFLHKGDLGRFHAGVLPFAFFLGLKRTNFKITEDIRRRVLTVAAVTFPAALVSGIDSLQVRGELRISTVTGALHR